MYTVKNKGIPSSVYARIHKWVLRNTRVRYTLQVKRTLKDFPKERYCTPYLSLVPQNVNLK